MRKFFVNAGKFSGVHIMRFCNERPRLFSPSFCPLGHLYATNIITSSGSFSPRVMWTCWSRWKYQNSENCSSMSYFYPSEELRIGVLLSWLRACVRPASHKISGRAADLASGLISLFFVFYYRLGIFLRTFFSFLPILASKSHFGGIKGPFLWYFFKNLRGGLEDAWLVRIIIFLRFITG